MVTLTSFSRLPWLFGAKILIEKSLCDSLVVQRYLISIACCHFFVCSEKSSSSRADQNIYNVIKTFAVVMSAVVKRVD